MAQQVKVQVAKLDRLGLVLRTHMVERVGYHTLSSCRLVSSCADTKTRIIN